MIMLMVHGGDDEILWGWMLENDGNDDCELICSEYQNLWNIDIPFNLKQVIINIHPNNNLDFILHQLVGDMNIHRLCDVKVLYIVGSTIILPNQFVITKNVIIKLCYMSTTTVLTNIEEYCDWNNIHFQKCRGEITAADCQTMWLTPRISANMTANAGMSVPFTRLPKSPKRMRYHSDAFRRMILPSPAFTFLSSSFSCKIKYYSSNSKQWYEMFNNKWYR